MPTVTGTLETLALELGRALAPLKDLLDSESLLNLGLELPRRARRRAGPGRRAHRSAHQSR